VELFDDAIRFDDLTVMPNMFTDLERLFLQDYRLLSDTIASNCYEWLECMKEYRLPTFNRPNHSQFSAQLFDSFTMVVDDRGRQYLSWLASALRKLVCLSR
jgi:hypothetical protein